MFTSQVYYLLSFDKCIHLCQLNLSPSPHAPAQSIHHHHPAPPEIAMFWFSFHHWLVLPVLELLATPDIQHMLDIYFRIGWKRFSHPFYFSSTFIINNFKHIENLNKWTHTGGALLSLASFIPCNGFEIHPHVSSVPLCVYHGVFTPHILL